MGVTVGPGITILATGPLTGAVYVLVTVGRFPNVFLASVLSPEIIAMESVILFQMAKDRFDRLSPSEPFSIGRRSGSFSCDLSDGMAVRFKTEAVPLSLLSEYKFSGVYPVRRATWAGDDAGVCPS